MPRKYARYAAKMFLALHQHVPSAEQTIIRAGEKVPKHTMPWIYRTRISITKSSLNRNLDQPQDPWPKEFGGSLQSCLLPYLSLFISMLLIEYVTPTLRCMNKLPDKRRS